MKHYYDYDKQLNFKKSFNIWQHNFERWPFRSQVDKIIKTVRNNTATFIPDKEIQIQKLKFNSRNESMDFYKISPKGMECCNLPVILYYHGGGFICPLDVMMLNNGSYYSKILKCHVILPEYSLAPTHSDQDMLTDCYNMLVHAYDHSGQLSLNMDKLIIFGDSAGGALAAGVTLMARDKALPKANGQMLIYPVTDYHVNGYKSMELKYAEWNKKASIHMWNLAFKKGKNVPEYIAPLTNGNHHGLPPAYIEVQEFDTLKDQGIAYGDKLKAANVPVQLRTVRGTYHGFDNQIDNPFVIQILNDRCKIMSDFLQ